MRKVIHFQFAYLLVGMLLSGCYSPNRDIYHCGEAQVLEVGLIRKQKLFFLGDLTEGLDCAKALHNPVLVVFTGYRCVGYDAFKMDLIRNSEIRNYLNSDFVLVILYVDDKSKLQKGEAEIKENYASHGIELNVGRRLLETGHLNSEIQVSLFNDNSQVFFGFFKPNGKQLIPSFYYNQKEVDFFLEKLEEAKKEWIKTSL